MSGTQDGVVVVGDSGHAKVCIELLRAMGQRVDWCVGVTNAQTCLGVPVLQGDEHLEILRRQGYAQAFVAVGANKARQRLAGVAAALGYRLVNAISPHALISPSAHVGSGVAIMGGVVINANADIGDLAIINTGATVDHDCRIGTAAHVAPQCGLAGNVVVGDLAFLGIGCKAIPEVRIGAGAVLGAGAVVVSDIPDSARAWGVPARTIQEKGAQE